MMRESFIQAQAAELDEVLGLIVGEERPRRQFEALALDTYDHLASVGRPVGFLFTPYLSASNWVAYDRRVDHALPDPLRERWRAWEEEYLHLMERQPALELRDALHSISESHDRSS